MNNRRKHYVFVGDELVEVRCKNYTVREQVNHDVGMHVDVKEVVVRNGERVLFPLCNTLERPRAVYWLVCAGAFAHEPVDWEVYGGIWIFGPGRGWTQSDAQEEADRLLSIFTSE